MTVGNDPEEFHDPQEQGAAENITMADANTQALIAALTDGIKQLQNTITMAITNATAGSNRIQ